jgi:hypothetical protein
MGLGRISFVLSLLVLGFTVKRFYDGGVFNPLHPHNEFSSCKKVYGISGPEDIIVLDSGIALISGIFFHSPDSSKSRRRS